MPSLNIGKLTFVGELGSSGHIEVTVLGAGDPGHRPLCGKIIINIEEWASLSQLDQVMAAADRQVAELTASSAAALSDIAKLDQLHLAELVRLDTEISKLRKERDAYSATFNLACRLQDADQCEDHCTGDDCEQGEVEHEFYQHLATVRTDDGRTDPLERGEKKRAPAGPSTAKHVLNDVEECVSWCPACHENRSRGLNPDGTAKVVAGG